MNFPVRMKMRTALSFISYVSILCLILTAQSCFAANETLENAAPALPVSTSDATGKSPGSTQIDPSPPAEPVRLIFIHHSTGENWLSDYNGGLGLSLRDNNYYVSDTNYGWGPNSIGDQTDIGHWWLWFRGPDSNDYMNSLYAESDPHCEYSRLPESPGGDNEIVMFKSCFPNSALQGDPSDPVPPIASNPLLGQDSGSEYHTVANAKGIYIDLLEYFRNHQEKLFIVITAPPLSDPGYSGNARAFNQWLVNDWLDGYPYSNVFVFDFYNVLTTNGGSPNVNDLGWIAGNHHRLWSGAISHSFDGDPSHNVLAYPTGDDHPSQAGNLKATGEFVTLLNVAYHKWKETPPAPPTWTTLAGYLTSSPSVITDGMGRTEIWAKGGDDSLWVNIDGTWYGKGGFLTSDPFAAIDHNGKVHVLVRGGDGSLWDFIYDPALDTGHWKSLGGYITEMPTIAQDPVNNGIMRVAVRGGDNALWICDLDINTESYVWASLGGGLTTRPYILFDPSGIEHILVRGGDNALWDKKGVWSGSSYTRTWSSLGGYLANAPIATIQPGVNNHAAVFVKGGDNALWVCDVFTGSEPETGTWHRLGGVITTDPFVVADTSANKIHAFVRGSDSSLWENIFSTSPWNPGGNQWQGIGGVLLAHTPGAFIRGNTQAFVIGTDNALWRNTHATFSASSSEGSSI
jgi:hypothetical protein